MEEEVKVLIPDKISRPTAWVSFDFDIIPKTIILDKSNLIIVKSHEPRIFIHDDM